MNRSGTQANVDQVSRWLTVSGIVLVIVGVVLATGFAGGTAQIAGAAMIGFGVLDLVSVEVLKLIESRRT